ncbi:MAG: OmpA family protein, partial [Halomonas sp.]|nr:OmpA family protein [Halomonas sp.]
FGGDELNQKLSQERADAVRQYLLANMSFDPARMDAIGYGETQPVASNETPEGRTRNRRIDVIIHPRLQSQ